LYRRDEVPGEYPQNWRFLGSAAVAQNFFIKLANNRFTLRQNSRKMCGVEVEN
jgi:hypothetical protein